MKSTITVSQSEINNGKRCLCASCPVALAGNKQFQFTEVYDEEMMFEINEDIFIAKLPPEAVKFVTRFDEGENVKPFNFEIDYHLATEKELKDWGKY